MAAQSTYADPGTRAMKVISTAYMMTEMMKTVLAYGTAGAISLATFAGKTGTSNCYKR